jgi:hypothetical protein
MQTKWLDEIIKYDGTQLASHFAHRHAEILGDSCVAFIGPAEVSLQAMVDLEDVRLEAPIYSPRMLHFILESFSLELKGAVLLQRLMTALIRETLQEQGVQGLVRRGDDLYRGEKKLSVSIATVSPVSSLIHTGLNILTEGVPVPAVGLKELGVEAEALGRLCLERIAQEYREMLRATYKVRPVS